MRGFSLGEPDAAASQDSSVRRLIPIAGAVFAVIAATAAYAATKPKKKRRQ